MALKRIKKVSLYHKSEKYLLV
ncbi:hypothetical protein RIR_e71679_A0A2N0QYF8_9GLOM [Rhizophagus irregularis DAOM 181602=DAOM 197198]|nr:hypothetical protein RIR_e71679_A0A2N0QYF8_9GLOM [Rhizophagus irregularis DAOM 181602=DAOM 197198]